VTEIILAFSHVNLDKSFSEIFLQQPSVENTSFRYANDFLCRERVRNMGG